jgi:phosphoglycerate dehydrogenase-like enzyme
MILGLGRIGSEVARVSSALGCHVMGVRRNVDFGIPEGVSELIPPDRVHSRLGEADFVVLALPATSETIDLVDYEFLAAMQSDAVLINVGRGETIVEEALVDSLRRGHPRAACLDVTRQQPLPRDSRLYRAPNLWLTHFTAYRTGAGEHGRNAERVFLENLERFVQGLPLQNQVDPGQGY